MQSLDLLWLVFDTGLILTPLMGHLGNLSSHCSVPVCCGCEREGYFYFMKWPHSRKLKEKKKGEV